MFQSKTVKVGLMLLLVIVAVGMIWSFVSRSRNIEEDSGAELLDPSVTRLSRDFDHSEFKLGRLQFRVQAGSHRLTSSGLENLEDVELIVFDENDGPAHRIRGQRASYDVESKFVRFSGEVSLELPDGTRVLCRKVDADLRREEIRIDEAFRFERGEAVGEAETLLYRIPLQVLEIGGPFSVTVEGGGEPLRAGSSEAYYDIREGRFILRQQSTLVQGRNRLEADEIVFVLREDRKVERLTARNQATYEDPFRRLTGAQISAVFDADVGRMEYFELLASPEEGASDEATIREKARYQDVSGPPGLTLEASRITGVPNPGETAQPLLESLRADREVRLSKADAGIERADSDSLRVTFLESGSPDQLELVGSVSVLRRFETGKDLLECRHLTLVFGTDGTMRQALARDEVSWETVGEDMKRNLSAQKFVQVEFEDGVVSELSARENVMLESIGPQGRSVVKSPAIDAVTGNRQIERVVAQQGVEFQFVDPKSPSESRSSTSKRAELFYDNGRLIKAVQSGDFRLQVGPAEAGTAFVEGEEAVFDPETGRATVTGPVPPRLTQPATAQGQGSSVTQAKRFEILVAEGDLIGKEMVRTQIRSGAREILVTSGEVKMFTETGWVEYSKKPRLEEPGRWVTGEIIRLRDEPREMTVLQNVESSWQDPDGEAAEAYRIRSDQLRVEESSGRATYQGQVVASTGTFVLRAPSVELSFQRGKNQESGSVDEVHAWGRVFIQEPGRTARGEEAFYFVSDGRIELLGPGAEVVDEKEGKASGQKLIFYPGKRSLVVESRALGER